MTDLVRTTCPYCGVGCGVLARRDGDGLAVAGDPDHPANHGRLCVKGAALGETVGLAARLLHPRVAGRRTDWGHALGAVADAFQQAIAAHGPDSVALYVSGQLLTEDYYVANKLMKGFIGTANIDTNSRLCMSSSVAGHVRAFGSDTVPGCYDDLEQADLVVLVGSNTAWCHPVVFQRLRAAKAARPEMRIVVIDPRRTATVEGCDLHLPIRGGTDVALFNGLLAHLERVDAIDHAFAERHTDGLGAALAAARGTSLAACDLDPAAIATFFDWFAHTRRVVTVYSQGVNQSTSGTDKVNAIINCHLATGRIGQPGMGPLSLTGQPNAMGGREVGGLANMLAAHMGFNQADRDRVARFWKAPAVATSGGLKAVDLVRAVAEGRIKALWVMATNPAVSLPHSTFVRQALEKCDFVAVSDCMERTDTTERAHVLLPALTWAEKDGTVTNSERRISRQRPVLPPPGEAKADWWIICQVAKRLGFGEAFAYERPAEIFREHARLSAFENEGNRDFDIGGLAEADYDGLQPVQWPVREPVRLQVGGTARLFGDGRFFHADGKARVVALTPRAPATQTSEAWPLVLNTGRTRDQWHTMTRTGKAPRLASHAPEPWLAVHPEDAACFGLQDGGLARVESALGQILLRVSVDDGQRRGEVFAPMHWNDQFASQAGVGHLIAPNTDPLSGQPELKFTAVRVRAVDVFWEGRLACRNDLSTDQWPADVFWARTSADQHVAYRLAGTESILDWPAWARERLGEGSWLEYRDRTLGLYRAALLRDGRLEAVLFIARPGELAALDWLDGMFARPSLAQSERADLLAGTTANRAAAGPIVCACHQVGRQAILNAIANDGLADVEAIGRHLRAGTNCGSCIPELRALLDQAGSARPPANDAGNTHKRGGA